MYSNINMSHLITCICCSEGSVGVVSWPCTSGSDSASSSSTSWMVGVTSEGGIDVFFFLRFFLRRRSMLSTLFLKRCGGRWVDSGWCVWWNVWRWSGRTDARTEQYKNIQHLRGLTTYIFSQELQNTATVSTMQISAAFKNNAEIDCLF